MAGGRRVGALVALVVGLVPVMGAGCALSPPPGGGSGGSGGSPGAVTVTRLLTPDGRPLLGAGIVGMTTVPDPSAEDQPGVGVVWMAPGRLAG